MSSNSYLEGLSKLNYMDLATHLKKQAIDNSGPKQPNANISYMSMGQMSTPTA